MRREELAGLAIHEGAHAVTFAVGALPFHHVELTPGDPVTAGAVRAYPAPPTRPRALYVAIVAGAIAEHRFTGRSLEEIAATCGAQDMSTADELAKDWSPALVTALWEQCLKPVDDLEGPYPSGDLEAIKQDRRANAGRKGTTRAHRSSWSCRRR